MNPEVMRIKVKDAQAKKEELIQYKDMGENKIALSGTRKNEIEAQIGILKRNLSCLFKHDPEVKEYVTVNRNIARLGRQIDIYSNKIQNIDQEIDAEIINFLEHNDSDYKEIKENMVLISEVDSVVGEFLKRINNALSAIDSAETTETMDMLTDNDTISAMSTIDSMSASAEIDEVKEYVDVFNEAVEKFKKHLEDSKMSHNSLSQVNDFVDLYFDFFLDINSGFDFTSLMSLSALGDAERDMFSLKKEVKKFNEEFQKIYDQYKDRQLSFVNKVKRELGISIPTN